MRAWFAAQFAAEERARSGFALFPIGMIVAALLVYRSSLVPSVGLIVLLVAPGLALVWLRASAPAARSGGRLLLGIAAGLAACHAEIARTGTTVFSGEATVRIAGTVTAREEDERGRYRYLVDISSTERPILSRPPERARIVVTSRHEPLAIGSRYVGLVRLRPPAGPAYPGAHDFAFAAYFAGLGAYGFSLGPPEAPEAVRAPTFWDRIATLRLAMGDRIRETLPGPTGAVAAALITGERAGIPDEINEDLRITGLAHVLSISGFHMALVAGFFMLATRFLLAAAAPVALYWPTKKLAALVALAATGFYFLLAGDNAATERSFVMIAIMLGAVLFDKPALTLRNVCIAAVVVIALAPHVVLTATFQMSFAATAALVGAYGAYARWRARRGGSQDKGNWAGARWIGILLLGMALSSLIAGAATAPFAIHHFQRAAPYSLIANLVATPIFSFWIMPLAMVAVLAMPLGLHAWPLAAMGSGLELVFRLAAALADALPDYATGQMGGAALLCFCAAILIISFSASALRWFALVPMALGIAILRPGPPPELLVFENGREAALIDAVGRLEPVRERPGAFVWEQWQRAYATGGETTAQASADATAELRGFQCRDGICRARTRSGITVGWSEDYEKLDELCRSSDIAIVARAVRQRECEGSGRLVTLRTLRRTGSLAISRAEDGTLVVKPSVPTVPQAWNRHRLAPWPEYWRREQTPNQPTGAPREQAEDFVSGSGGSDPPASPGP